MLNDADGQGGDNASDYEARESQPESAVGGRAEVAIASPDFRV